MPNPDPQPPTDDAQQNPAVIDFLKFDAQAGRVHLVLFERKPWDLNSEQPFLLQEKLNAYLSFVLDGEMLEVYPAFQGKPICICLECAEAPPNELLPFLQLVRDQCDLQGIEFVVEVRGAFCGCGKPSSDCERN